MRRFRPPTRRPQPIVQTLQGSGIVMSWKRRMVIGAVSIVALAAAAWCWREVTRVHTVIITVPDGDGYFVVWRRDAHPDVVEVQERVARFAIPSDGLLRARSMACLQDWHTERYVDRLGQVVEDVHGLGTAVSSSWDGAMTWWYRGAKSNLMFDNKARAAWLSKKGIAR
jgi:hypothetical protein